MEKMIIKTYHHYDGYKIDWWADLTPDMAWDIYLKYFSGKLRRHRKGKSLRYSYAPPYVSFADAVFMYDMEHLEI
jgi:hypothetical protein